MKYIPTLTIWPAMSCRLGVLWALIGLGMAGCASTPSGVSDTATKSAVTSAPVTDTVPSAPASPSSSPPALSGSAPAASLPEPGAPVPDDLWNRIRQGFAMPTLDNDLVRTRERWYVSQPDYIERMSTRGSRYLYFIVEELERRGMPTELALLPFVESAFNPTAVSSARAEGMWQFMPATGRTYQLTQNIFRDDRRDVLESTRAALDYLQRLHTMFEDWHLALAAYNWGEGNVQRAINRNQAKGLPTHYTSLSMPLETRHYVPKLQALKNIIAAPENYNVTLIELPNHPYFRSVPIQRDIDVTLAARLAGISLTDFHTLNPSQKKPVILAAGTPQILLPYDNAERFEANLAKYKGNLASWTAWIVPRTMKTAEAATVVGMHEHDLLALNNIPPKMLVRSGSTLLVKRTSARAHDVPEAVAESAAMNLAPDLPPLKRVRVVAARGDTVQTLAKRYRISAAQIAQWNKIQTATALRPGQTVALWLPTASGPASLAKRKSPPPSTTAKTTPSSRPEAGSQRRGTVKTARKTATSPGRPAAGQASKVVASQRVNTGTR